MKKKDSTWHFCVDYRDLNAVTIKDRFPILTVEELLDELAKARIFKLVFRAVRTHDSHYEFLVMSFVLTNAPSLFQSLINSTFKEILRKFVVIFFDDILVYSTDWNSHLEHLREVLI